MPITKRKLAKSTASYAAPALPTQCGGCGLPELDFLSTLAVKSLLVEPDNTYLLKGRVRLEYCAHGQCRNCGSVYTQLTRLLPVQYTNLPCPACEQIGRLRYRLSTLDLGPKSFKFAVIGECEACKWRRASAKVLRAVWRVLRIRVSLGIIDIEKVTEPSE
jgi:hypothetical protein